MNFCLNMVNIIHAFKELLKLSGKMSRLNAGIVGGNHKLYHANYLL